MKYTLSNRDGNPKKKRNSFETRVQLGLRFKYLCIDAGMKVPEVAQALQVTERTVYAWISGKTRVPYSAYRLLRVINHFELPVPGWTGWHMHSGRLWSPEGHGFTPDDSSHWALLIRKANTWRELYDRVNELEDWVRAYAAAGEAKHAAPPAGLACDARAGGAACVAGRRPGGREAPDLGPNLLLSHFTTNANGEVGHG